MAKIQAEMCHSCHDSGYCIIHWGAECKRQGGSRIPRMKTMFIKAQNKLGNFESIKQAEPKKAAKPRKKNINMFGPIRTKAANW